MSEVDRKFKLYRGIQEHKSRLVSCLHKWVCELIRRGEVHDNSKLVDPEFSGYASALEEFEKHPFGSEGYFKAKESIADAVKHHYENNTHHPEHWTNGIDDMDLIDVLEMVADWKAATLNHPKHPGNMDASLKYAIEKYKISPQMAKVIYNTIQNFKL